MWRGVAVSTVLLSVWPLIGCATPYTRGQSALRQGRYGEAASRFQDVLAHDPDRLDALVGLGISRYKDGALDEAAGDINRAVVRQPENRVALLYLALAYLRKGEDRQAEQTLTRLRGLKLHPRLAAQIDRTLTLIRQAQPLTDELRNFIAASLEDEVEWVLEIREASLIRASQLTCCNFFGVDHIPPHRMR